MQPSNPAYTADRNKSNRHDDHNNNNNSNNDGSNNYTNDSTVHSTLTKLVKTIAIECDDASLAPPGGPALLSVDVQDV